MHCIESLGVKTENVESKNAKAKNKTIKSVKTVHVKRKNMKIKSVKNEKMEMENTKMADMRSKNVKIERTRTEIIICSVDPWHNGCVDPWGGSTAKRVHHESGENVDDAYAMAAKRVRLVGTSCSVSGQEC